MCAVDSVPAVAGGRRPDSRSVHNNSSRSYRARNPAASPLNRIVRANFLEFKESLKEPPSGKPRPHPSVITAIEKFSECGVMRYGVVRFRCPDCGHDMFVAFSCKRRGLCPSCDAKRSDIIVASAMDRLLPAARYRQWVLVIPKRLRYFVNVRPDLTGYLSKLLAREINRYLKSKTSGVPAQLHFIQRFGGALNLHIHIHAVVSDGTFTLRDGALGGKELIFNAAPGSNERELDKIVTNIRKS